MTKLYNDQEPIIIIIIRLEELSRVKIDTLELLLCDNTERVMTVTAHVEKTRGLFTATTAISRNNPRATRFPAGPMTPGNQLRWRHVMVAPP